MSKLSKRARNRTKVQMILTVLVIVSIIRQFFLGNYHNMFLGILTLILFMVPQFIDKKLGVTIPVGLETVILIFIFSAEILGEINAFYVKIPVWDTILHTTNGFLMAAIGFALIDLFNRSDRFSIKMSPYFVAFFAFCFSMTVGVLWEFFEFSMDWFFGMDMQKDWIVPACSADGERWLALGRLKDERALRRIMVGERVQALAAADDFLRMNESDDAAKKNRRWLNDAATAKQWELLQRLGYGQEDMFTFTKYSAACTLNFFWNRQAIEREVLHA